MILAKSKTILPRQCGTTFIGIARRFQSTNNLNDIPMRLIAIPLTTHKSFIYCKHNALSKTPDSQGIIDKLIKKSVDIWDKFSKSESTINKKIVEGVEKLLSKIPWDEYSLKSIPSLGSIVRELKESSSLDDDSKKQFLFNKDEKTFVKQEDLINKNVDYTNDHLHQIPVFFPSSITSEDLIRGQLLRYSTEGYKAHYRKLVICLIGLPFTVPFIVLPVVPNIPGFYLCYRLYCHYAAIKGAQHLQMLTSENHLLYKNLDHDSLSIYRSTKDQAILQNLEQFLSGNEKPSLPGDEKLILGEDAVEQICKSFGCEELIKEVKLALQQERHKLTKL